MWYILLSVALGIAVGLIFKPGPKALKLNSKIQMLGLYALLFSMGAAMGSNKDIIASLKSIGLMAVVFALLTSIASALLIYLSAGMLLRRGER